jgi:hypothetical protein
MFARQKVASVREPEKVDTDVVRRLIQNDSMGYEPSMKHVVDEYLENSRISFKLLGKSKNNKK